jgi:hypothetical protein
VTTARALIALACLMTVAVLGIGALLAQAVRRDVVVCEESLPAVPEPPGWQAWPVAPELGGFGLSYWTSMPKYHLGYSDVSLVELGVCPGEGASVEPWFAASERGDASYLRNPGELRVRHSPDGEMHVVTGRVDGAGPEWFVAAFVRQHGHRLALLSRRAAACLGADAVALVVLLAGIARAVRRLRLAGRILDPSLFQPATRDPGGRIRMGATAVTTEGNVAGAPGDVMVRVVSARPGDYRTAPSRHVTVAVDGERHDAVRATARASSWAAAAAMGAALLLGLGTCFVLLLVGLSELRLD